MEARDGTAALIGRPVRDVLGRRVGRVVAVIHRVAGVDVLVERRRLLGRRVHRVRLDDLERCADGSLVVAATEAAPARLTVVAPDHAPGVPQR